MDYAIILYVTGLIASVYHLYSVGRLKGLIQLVQGAWLNARIASKGSKARREAERAVLAVVRQTGIEPSRVVASVVCGGPCILVRVEGRYEAFIHHSYARAAVEAVRWIRAQPSHTLRRTSV